MIEQDFYAKIKDLPLVEDVVGTRIYYGLADQDETLPIIVIALEGHERQYAADGVCQATYDVSVSVFASDYQQARMLQEQITTSIENDDFGGQTHKPLLAGFSMVSEKKDDASDANIHHVEMLFNVVSRS